MFVTCRDESRRPWTLVFSPSSEAILVEVSSVPMLEPVVFIGTTSQGDDIFPLGMCSGLMHLLQITM